MCELIYWQQWIILLLPYIHYLLPSIGTVSAALRLALENCVQVRRSSLVKVPMPRFERRPEKNWMSRKYTLTWGF